MGEHGGRRPAHRPGRSGGPAACRAAGPSCLVSCPAGSPGAAVVARSPWPAWKSGRAAPRPPTTTRRRLAARDRAPAGDDRALEAEADPAADGVDPRDGEDAGHEVLTGWHVEEGAVGSKVAGQRPAAGRRLPHHHAAAPAGRQGAPHAGAEPAQPRHRPRRPVAHPLATGRRRRVWGSRTRSAVADQR